jgi:hypothetical protein
MKFHSKLGSDNMADTPNIQASFNRKRRKETLGMHRNKK